MSSSLRVPGARLLPGRVRSDSGAVAVESAIALVALAGVVGALLWGLGLLAAQLALGEASRAAARAAARGEQAVVVVDEAHRLAPGADVSIDQIADRVQVRVERVVTAPGLLARLGSFRLSAVATAGLEPGSGGSP